MLYLPVRRAGTPADMTKQGVMNHAPTNTTERQRRASALEKQIDEMVRAGTPAEIAIVEGKG